MPRFVITHKVADVDTWLSFSSERAAAIGDLGAIGDPGGGNVVDHVEVEGAELAIKCGMEDVEATPAVLQSAPPELVSTMEKHGVIQPLAVFVAR